MNITVRLPSKAVQYGYIEMVTEVPDNSTPMELGHVYAQAVKDFWEGEKGAKPKAPDSAAQEAFERELGAKKISEEPNEKPVEDGKAPWETEKPAVKAKPWEGKAPSLFG